MKKILLSISYFLTCIISSQAQTLYGTTYHGGNEDQGTINKFITTTNTLTVARSFESIATTPYYTNLIQAADGKLYGMTLSGGSNGSGVIFSYDPSSTAYIKLKDFDSTNGASPYGSLMQASDGKLYGMTSKGGSSDSGVIFSYDPSTSTYLKLKDFDGADGATPFGSLMQANDGKLYGMTNVGGINSSGVIFSFDPVTSTYATLKDLDSANGSNPFGSLIQATDGKLYGMTNKGGSNNDGVIFSYDPVSSTYTKLQDFDFNVDGGNPYGSLMQAIDGKLYGMTNGQAANNGGAIFSFDPSDSSFLKLKDLDYPTGSNPYGDLMQANDGKLYGMTADGINTIGNFSTNGALFSFDPSSAIYTKLKDFDFANGTTPHGSLMQATDGKLYGMTSQGGGSSGGVIFSFDIAPTTYTKLKDIGSNDGGSNVIASLVRASNGKLYGVTNKGGSSGVGVIFSFDPLSSSYTKLVDFDNNNGATPYGSLIQASDGKLYGMTNNGGSSDSGVIFSFDPVSLVYTKLKDFHNTDGANPDQSLLQASDGKLYGTTGAGGNNSLGVIFSLDPSTSIYTKLRDFDGPTAGGPLSSFIQATDGKLYGIAGFGGGNSHGAIFSFDPLSSTYTEVKDFDNVGPQGSLVQAGDGKLYGMTTFGGTGCNCGTIFSYDLSSTVYTELKDFDNINGLFPYGNLMQASDSMLYGTTISGGSNNKGVIFSFDPSSSTFTKLIDFNGANGASPNVNSAFIEVPGGALPVTLVSFTGKNDGNYNQLSWKVENEQNLNYYELQRSSDGQNFKSISQVKAAGNNSYTYNDPIATIVSIYYYRLKSVDKDGKFKYSVIVKIRTDHNGFVVVNPNPFKNKLVVNIESLIQDKATLIINDISGKQLYKGNKLLSPGTNVVEINEAGRLSKGTYLVTIITSQQTQSITVVKGN